VFLCLLRAPPAVAVAVAAPAAQLSSPDGRLWVALDLDVDDGAIWSLTRDGKPVIAPSRLGFILADHPKLPGREAQHRRRIPAVRYRPRLPLRIPAAINPAYVRIQEELTEFHIAEHGIA